MSRGTFKETLNLIAPHERSLLLSGGRQKKRLSDEWRQYDLAVMLRLHGETGGLTTAAEYVSPSDACPDEEPSINFKAASIDGNHLYVPTNTEILMYEVPSFKREGYISLPFFNDVHYVCPSRKGTLYVVSSGLDMVAEITREGTLIQEWPVAGTDIWAKFSRGTDYRKVPTTKPHVAHPNFVVEVGDDLWVSRGMLKDAICLTQPGRRIEFCHFIHDGVKHDGKVYFTTVNGNIYVVDEKTMSIERSIDLNSTEDRGAHMGWMRGILPLANNLCWVGFTRLRPTKLKENLKWVRNGLKNIFLPTRIALYDLSGAPELLCEVDLEPHDLNAIYSILIEPVKDASSQIATKIKPSENQTHPVGVGSR